MKIIDEISSRTDEYPLACAIEDHVPDFMTETENLIFDQTKKVSHRVTRRTSFDDKVSGRVAKANMSSNKLKWATNILCRYKSLGPDGNYPTLPQEETHTYELERNHGGSHTQSGHGKLQLTLKDPHSSF